MQLTWKDIPVVPNSTEFLDVVLNRTQRKTPTVIRPGFQITRIREFYMRKVRYTADGFSEKLQEIIDSFPRINDVHPFHRDLLDTLYEKNHYKVSLASLSRAKALIDQVSRDYVRLLKFGQSLFQCKQLKRAALGRMATITKRLKDPLLYLEQVRQHMGRLPAIDPNTRTLLICGYPNVGKSSFLRSVTRAEVEVQPYAFTTKALYVGHFDYKYLRFQAIDTPGILDRPTEEMNNIEMQSIYSIAHVRSCVLYFMDLSEQCGFSVQDQVKLYHSIKPLFANKTVMVVINKVDLVRPEDLDPERQEMLQSIANDVNVEMVSLSCATEENIMAVRNKACEKLLTARVEQKMKSHARVQSLMNRINVAKPEKRDEVERPKVMAPEQEIDPDRKLSRDVEEENGGAGVYTPNYKEDWLLEDDQWKKDIVPEIIDGRNVYDFIDPDISSKLEALEKEEEQLESQGFYADSDQEMEDSETEDIRAKAAWIRKRHRLMRNESKMKETPNPIPRNKKAKRSIDEMEQHFDDIGMDAAPVAKKARGKSRIMVKPRGADAVVAAAQPKKVRDFGLPSNVNERGVKKAEKERKFAQRKWAQDGRQGESDRRTQESLTRRLVAGKRGIGKTNAR